MIIEVEWPVAMWTTPCNEVYCKPEIPSSVGAAGLRAAMKFRLAHLDYSSPVVVSKTPEVVSRCPCQRHAMPHWEIMKRA